MRKTLTSTSATPSSPTSHTVIGLNENLHDFQQFQRGFDSLIQMVEQHVNLAISTKDGLPLQVMHPRIPAPDVSDHSFWPLDLRLGLEQLDQSGIEASQFLQTMISNLCPNTEAQIIGGRNIFVGDQGSIGFGPWGLPAAGNPKDETAVWLGDFIAIIPKAIAPVILRPAGNGTYLLVGPAYIGCLAQTPTFQPGAMPDLVPFLIR